MQRVAARGDGRERRGQQGESSGGSGRGVKKFAKTATAAGTRTVQNASSRVMSRQD